METNIMAQALGYVTQTENGDYEGTLAMGVNARIRITRNAAKEPGSKQPDFRIFSPQFGELGGGWTRTGKTSGREYVSLTLAHPMISQRRVYANLGPASGGQDGEFALLWNAA